MSTPKLGDREAFARWFGAYNSARKYADMEWAPEEPLALEHLRAVLAQGTPLIRNPASRFSFVRGDAGGVLLFVDGACHDCAGDTAAFAEMLCAGDCVAVGAKALDSDAVMELITRLFNQGSVGFEID